MTVPVALVFTVLVAVAVAGFLFAARLTVRTGGLRPSWETPTEPEPEPPPGRTGRPAPRPAGPAPPGVSAPPPTPT